MKTNPPSHTSQTLSWSEGLPYSTQFGDVYFSVDSGLEESRHVFHQHNHLATRWQALPAHGQFVIGETGFGTGLNFLAAVELWLRTAPQDARLYYLTVEKFPLSKVELKQALALWPALSTLCDLLVAAYPDQLEAEIYPLSLFDGRVQLILTIDDATAGFNQQIHRQHPDFMVPKTSVDAWFLDGFAPSKNADMWSSQLFATLALLSHADTTFATYTCAGSVRRGLAQAGFRVAKQKGFGRKREMLSGRFCTVSPLPDDTDPSAQPGKVGRKKATPWQAFKLQPPGRRACVVGAGIAGCHTARALAESGWQVTVVEAKAAPAQMASGNAQGIVYAKLSPKRHPQGRFNITSLNYAQAAYAAFWQARPAYGAACGVLQLADKDDAAEQQHASAATLPASLAQPVTAEQASALAGIQLKNGGLFLPNAGWLNPAALCTWLLQHANIDTQFDTQITSFEATGDGRWHIRSTKPQAVNFDTDLLVLCCADQAKRFPQTQHLPLKRIRGQVTELPATDTSQHLKKVVTQEGYLAPAFAGNHCVGATFNLKLDDPAPRAEDHLTNLAFLANLDNFYGQALPDVSTLNGRVGFRCTSPDYLPLVGPVAKEDEMAEAYALLAKNAKRVIPSANHYWPNLLVNLAHGSRGLAYTPICAHYLAALANNLPVPIRQDLCEALNPARFLIRDIARGKR